MKKFSVILFFILFIFFSGKNDNTLSWIQKTKLNIPEPSDICYSPKYKEYFIASDNGILFKVDENGKVLQRASHTGFDFEGVCCNDSEVIIMDESLRQLVYYNINSLELKKTIQLNYNGGRNLGYESITYNPVRNSFLMCTEKNPCLLHEYDVDKRLIGQFEMNALKEISSATFYKGKLWLLSDEKMSIYRMNADNFSIEEKYKIPVINPEGICFNDEGTLFIVSDDRATLYKFKLPE